MCVYKYMAKISLCPNMVLKQTCMSVCMQAVCGGMWSGPGSERETDKRGSAGVSWWDEGQLQRPDQRAIAHHAWTGTAPFKSVQIRNASVLSVFVSQCNQSASEFTCVDTQWHLLSPFFCANLCRSDGNDTSVLCYIDFFNILSTMYLSLEV